MEAITGLFEVISDIAKEQIAKFEEKIQELEQMVEKLERGAGSSN